MAHAAAAASDPWAATYALNAPRPAQATHTYPLPAPPEAQAARPVPDILARPRDTTRSSEVDLSALQFLFAEMVAYAQTRVSGIAEFERLLSTMGARVGQRALVLLVHRKETSANPKKPRRETRLLPTLLWLHTAFWKAVFGMQADSLERSTESGRNDECTCRTDRSHDFDQRPPLFARHLDPQGDGAAECRGICRRHCRGRTGCAGLCTWLDADHSPHASRRMGCRRTPIPTGPRS